MAEQIEHEEDGFWVEGNRLLLRQEGRVRDIARAIEIAKAERDLDSGEVSITFRFSHGGEWREASLPRVRFTNVGIMALRAFGADVHDGNRHGVWSFLHDQEEALTPSLRHKGQGWRQIEDKPCFCHRAGIGVDSTYAGGYELGPKGSRKMWKRIVKEHVLGRPLLELLLAIGFSSALVHPLEGRSNLKSLFVHCWGDSSKGKTTGLQLALSVWGLPENCTGGLLRTWNSTDNALAASLRGNRGVAVGFDEASMSLSSDFSRLIYQLAEGQEKARLDDRSNFQESGEWRTTILSTGEFSLLEYSRQNTGLRVRLLEIGNREWTDSASHSESLKAGLREHYGHAGPALARHLCSTDWGEVEKVWESWRDQVKQRLSGGPFDQRVAGKLAVILTSAELANDALGLGLDTGTMLETLVDLERANPTQGIGVRAHEAFLQYAFQHANRFKSSGNGEEFGRLIHDANGELEAVLVLPDPFKRIMRDIQVESSEAVLQDWKAKGLLIHDKEKLTVKRKISDMTVRVHYVLSKPRGSSTIESPASSPSGTPTVRRPRKPLRSLNSTAS